MLIATLKPSILAYVEIKTAGLLSHSVQLAPKLSSSGTLHYACNLHARLSAPSAASDLAGHIPLDDLEHMLKTSDAAVSAVSDAVSLKVSLHISDCKKKDEERITRRIRHYLPQATIRGIIDVHFDREESIAIVEALLILFLCFLLFTWLIYWILGYFIGHLALLNVYSRVFLFLVSGMIAYKSF